MSGIYEDSYEREEKDLNLHIAKMIEHMEYENTLPELEKNKRRLIRSIQGLYNAAETAAKTDTPWLLFGQLERMCFYAEQILGEDWREQAQRQRRAFFDSDEDDDQNGEYDFNDDASFDEL